MVDHVPGIGIRDGLQGEAVPLLLLIDPGGQRLLDDPPFRGFKPFGERVDLFRQCDGNVCG
jgi:hypothetical protein